MLIMVTFVPAIQAYEKGDILLRGGYTNIATQSSNGTTVNVGDKGNLTAAVSYFISNQWSTEILLGLPFEHDIYLKTGEKIVLESTFHPRFHSKGTLIFLQS